MDSEKNTTKRHPMDLSLMELISAIHSGEITPLESVTACFERITTLNPTINAICIDHHFDSYKQSALQLARHQSSLPLSELPPLAGIPFGVKDLEDCRDMLTTFGSLAFKDNISKSDSVVVQRLRDAGAIPIAKTNVPIFGSTIITTNKLYGTTVNPQSKNSKDETVNSISPKNESPNMNLTPGGSSGGSALAVAWKIFPFCTAADGGGSIRCPAAFTGCFGLKPSRGRVPVSEMATFGMQKFAHVVHQGVITRNVRDTAVLLDIIAGFHASDPYSLPKCPGSFLEELRKPTRAMKILFSADLGFVSYVDKTIEKAVKAACGRLSRYGHEIVFKSFEELIKESNSVIDFDVEMDWMRLASMEQMVAIKPFLENIGKVEDLEKGYKLPWQLFQGVGIDILGDIFRTVKKIHSSLRILFEGLKFDMIITPTMPVLPFDAEGPLPNLFDNPFHIVGFLTPFNLSGHPAASVRVTDQIGMQVVGPMHRDDEVMHVCQQVEAVTSAVSFSRNSKDPSKL